MNARLIAAALACALPAAVLAQSYAFVPRIQPELSAGYLGGAVPRGVLGIGMNVPADYPVRVAGTVAFEPALKAGDPSAVRVEAVGRFLGDPFRETRWGPYVGAGLGATFAQGDHGRASIVAVTGAELPGRQGWRPSLEVGIGGGVRAQVVLRHARRNGR